MLDNFLADWLLVHPDIEVFTPHYASGHGSHHGLTIAEQVTGRRKQVVFWLELKQARAEAILTELKQDFAGTQLHYWQTPLG